MTVVPTVMRRQVIGARHAIVHERAGDELAVLVIDHALAQRLAETPWAMPPWTWPSTIIGLTGDAEVVDHPVQATTSVLPVSVSTSTSQIK